MAALRLAFRLACVVIAYLLLQRMSKRRTAVVHMITYLVVPMEHITEVKTSAPESRSSSSLA